MKNQTDTYSELKDRIRSLKENRERHEALILTNLSKVYAITQNPASYIRQVTKDLSGDKDFRMNLLKIGLNLGANYLYKVLSQPENEASLVSLLSEKLGLKNETKKTGGFVQLLTKFISTLSK